MPTIVAGGDTKVTVAAYRPRPAAYRPRPAAYRPRPAAYRPRPAAYRPPTGHDRPPTAATTGRLPATTGRLPATTGRATSGHITGHGLPPALYHQSANALPGIGTTDSRSARSDRPTRCYRCPARALRTVWGQAELGGLLDGRSRAHRPGPVQPCCSAARSCLLSILSNPRCCLYSSRSATWAWVGAPSGSSSSPLHRSRTASLSFISHASGGGGEGANADSSGGVTTCSKAMNGARPCAMRRSFPLHPLSMW